MKLFIGDLVEPVDVPAIFLRELLQPNVGVFSQQHDGRHPGLVGAEGLVFHQRRLVACGVATAAAHSVCADHILIGGVEAGELVAFESFAAASCVGAAVAAGSGRVELHPDGNLFLVQDVHGQQYAAQVSSQQRRPLLPDELQLAGERIRRGKHGRAQNLY